MRNVMMLSSDLLLCAQGEAPATLARHVRAQGIAEKDTVAGKALEQCGTPPERVTEGIIQACRLVTPHHNRRQKRDVCRLSVSTVNGGSPKRKNCHCLSPKTVPVSPAISMPRLDGQQQDAARKGAAQREYHIMLRFHPLSLAMASVLASGILLTGCGGSSSSSPRGPQVDLSDLDPAQAAYCDQLISSHCLYPFPNNYFTVSDDATPTQLRV